VELVPFLRYIPTCRDPVSSFIESAAMREVPMDNQKPGDEPMGGHATRRTDRDSRKSAADPTAEARAADMPMSPSNSSENDAATMDRVLAAMRDALRPTPRRLLNGGLATTNCSRRSRAVAWVSSTARGN
jgi:hypothetical protein